MVLKGGGSAWPQAEVGDRLAREACSHDIKQAGIKAAVVRFAPFSSSADNTEARPSAE